MARSGSLKYRMFRLGDLVIETIARGQIRESGEHLLRSTVKIVDEDGFVLTTSSGHEYDARTGAAIPKKTGEYRVIMGVDWLTRRR